METYNPIVKESFRFERRIIGELHRTPVGYAYVLFGNNGGAVVLEQGRTLGRRAGIFGGYTEGFKVDMRKQRLEKTVDLPCRDDAHHFTVTFQMTCWVTDPLAVIQDAIQDAGAVLWSSVIRHARDVSRQHSLDETARAEQAITNRLADVELHQAFGTELVDISLSPDPQAVENSRLNTGMAFWNPLVKNSLAAAHLAQHPGDTPGMLEVTAEQLRQLQDLIKLFEDGGGRIPALEWRAMGKEAVNGRLGQMGLWHQDDSAEGVQPILPPQELPMSSDEDEDEEGEGDLA